MSACVPRPLSARLYAVCLLAVWTHWLCLGLLGHALYFCPSSGCCGHACAQPGRVLHFLPAVTSGTPQRPILSRPLSRDVAVPRSLGIIQAFWKSHEPVTVLPSANLYGSHSCKCTLLAWGRQLHLSKALRRIQPTRLSGAHMSVELYGRDDVVPMLEFQRLIIQHIRSGFRPLQPLARGTSLPLPDFAVALPPPLLTSHNPPLLPPLPVADDGSRLSASPPSLHPSPHTQHLAEAPTTPATAPPPTPVHPDMPLDSDALPLCDEAWEIGLLRLRPFGSV